MSDDNKQQPTSDEVRAKVIEDFDFDVDTQGEQIDVAVNKEIESQKNLSKTIEQKAKYREQGVKAGILDSKTFEPIEKKPEGESNEPNKPNTEQSTPTMEHMAILAQDANLDKLKLAEDYAQVKGVTLTEAYKSSVMQAEFKEMDNKAQIQSNSIGASSGSPSTPRAKSVSNMTDDEHRKLWETESANAKNA